ncbi:TPA: hypothetical protein JLL51_004465 [Escherichia coli]|nr:hypothetical protein [Escherichia coli]
MNTNEMNELRNTIKHLEQANVLHRKQLATNSKLIQQFKRRLDVLENNGAMKPNGGAV